MNRESLIQELTSASGKSGSIDRIHTIIQLEVGIRKLGISPDELLYFSVFYGKIGAFDQARRCAEELAKLSVGNPNFARSAIKAAINLYAGYAQHNEVTLPLVQKLARKILLSEPNNVYAAATLGAFLIQQKRWALASRLRKKFIARSDTAVSESEFLSNAIRMFDPHRLCAEWQGNAASVPNDGGGDKRINAGRSPVVVFSCDQKYWKAFSGKSIESLWNSNPEQFVHVHLVFPDNECIASLNDIRNKNKNRFNFTYEERSVDHIVNFLPGDRIKVYFASSRFFVAQRLAEQYKRALLIFDIDAVFLRPLGTLIRELGESNVTLLHYPNSTPLFEFGAGIVYINHTDTGKRFLTDVSSYIENCIRRGHGYWFLDQVSLYTAYYGSKSTAAGINAMRFAQIGQYVHFAGIFTGGNTVEAKLADIS